MRFPDLWIRVRLTRESDLESNWCAPTVLWVFAPPRLGPAAGHWGGTYLHGFTSTTMMDELVFQPVARLLDTGLPLAGKYAEDAVAKGASRLMRRRAYPVDHSDLSSSFAHVRQP